MHASSSRNTKPAFQSVAPMSVTATGAEILVDCLVASGVRTIFGLPGDTGVALYDALYNRTESIRHVLVRDERHAAFMADAYARSTNTVGVMEVSSGGGTTFAVGGLGEAFAASVPLLVITSDIQAASRGTGALTEIDQPLLFAAVTKWRRRVDSACDIPSAVLEALEAATSGRPAPVALILPENVLDERTERQVNHLVTNLIELPRSRPSADPGSIAQAAVALVKAERPAIVAGSGVHMSKAWRELEEFADWLAIPVGTTIQGKGSISSEVPWSLGVLGGNGGSDSANALLREADVVLLVGTRANATDTDSWTAPARKGSTIIGIDIDGERAGRNFPGSIHLVGDAATILRALRSSTPRYEGHRREIDFRPPARPKPQDPELSQLSTPLAASDVVRAVAETLGDRAHIVFADPGTPTPYVSSLWPTPLAGRTVIAPRGHGPMGYALPAAIGASIAHPEIPVVAFTADGGFAMCCGELETVSRLGLPIIYVQLTNNSLGWIKMLQHLYTDARYFGVDPGPIDSVMVARACGLMATRVSSILELQTAVSAAITERRSVYIDVQVRHLIDDVPEVSSWHAALSGGSERPNY